MFDSFYSPVVLAVNICRLNGFLEAMSSGYEMLKVCVFIWVECCSFSHPYWFCPIKEIFVRGFALRAFGRDICLPLSGPRSQYFTLFSI